ncbi:MAG: NAD-dependent epimerase/dehydratase family protein [archaeon]
MKILVTGSKGFVGKRVVSELKNRKHNIIEFDLANGQDILNKNHIKEALKGADAIIHLAAIIENSSPCLWEVNVNGTKTLLDEAIKAHIDKFVLLSSTGVYGFTKENVDEETPTAPENNYEKSKLEAEKEVLSRQEEISVSIVRSAMVFGANEYWKKMFRMLDKNYPLPCDGKNTFQIIFVEDLARAIALVLEKGQDGEVYLAAGEDKLSLNAFCESIKSIIGKEGKMKHIPSWIALIFGKIFRAKIISPENIRHLSKERNYDISKIEALGYKQKYCIKEAIEKTIDEIAEL